MTNPANYQLFWIYGIFIMTVLIAGFYCLIMTRNIMRALIGAELLMKAITLLIIIAGHITGNMALAQSIVITLIVVEVVVIAVGCGIALSIFRYNDSLDSRKMSNLKG